MGAANVRAPGLDALPPPTLRPSDTPGQGVGHRPSTSRMSVRASGITPSSPAPSSKRGRNGGVVSVSPLKIPYLVASGRPGSSIARNVLWPGTAWLSHFRARCTSALNRDEKSASQVDFVADAARGVAEPVRDLRDRKQAAIEDSSETSDHANDLSFMAGQLSPIKSRALQFNRTLRSLRKVEARRRRSASPPDCDARSAMVRSCQGGTAVTGQMNRV